MLSIVATPAMAYWPIVRSKASVSGRPLQTGLRTLFYIAKGLTQGTDTENSRDFEKVRSRREGELRPDLTGPDDTGDLGPSQIGPPKAIPDRRANFQLSLEGHGVLDQRERFSVVDGAVGEAI